MTHKRDTRTIADRAGFCNRGCDRAFSSDSAFDSHLIGPPANFRCATDEELAAKKIIRKTNPHDSEIWGFAAPENRWWVFP